MDNRVLIKKNLENYFGYTSFRDGQEEVILSALDGNHTLVMLPTGMGKSLCYQLTGYCLDGLVVIVSPLLSLMQDQVEQLKLTGEKRVAAINSLMDAHEKEWVLNHLSEYKFIFLSPEMLQQEYVMSYLEKVSISLFTIDEAHCISQWGLDFRPDYSDLGIIRQQLKFPLTMALTATATERVREEILTSLQIDHENTKQVIYSVDRSNIAFSTLICDHDKKQQLINQIQKLKKPGIIYFSSKKIAEEVAGLIRNKTGMAAESYHSDIVAEDKIKIQQQFIHDEIDIICATSAFGMGINKSNIRFVIHFHLPGSPEAYLQEVGRCGRDGEPSLALLLYEPGDGMIQLRLQEYTLPTIDMLEYSYKKGKVLEGSCSPTQKQLIENYLKSDLSVEAAKNQVKSRMIYKQQQLYYMIDYAETSSCKRAFLLHYFNEKVSGKPPLCCSNCNIEINECYKETDLKQKKIVEKEKNPEETLKELFLIGN
ncbi:ATP-dependent DNA helicase RecQ [Carnobacterium alterfunditum]|uniref:ATP-dependent DNA helicase RecQ n=1 Tax=Carnobacterium alterfunditum TaxID=28230 RepID=A0A1N6GV51_9LACT|nr:ATP-dependent DNA helicase RecQ [Carnobacterium alterfunditum]SIO11408.1 ATP-dependent DNA helicase RecQ [Carnobacterium alterfunditum]